MLDLIHRQCHQSQKIVALMKNRPVVVGVSSIQQKGTFDELDEPLIYGSAAKAAIRIQETH